MRPRCPFCHNDRHRPSWLGIRRFRGQEYRWIECTACGTSYYDPMPDDRVLREVYGVEYLNVNQSADAPGSPKDHRWVVEQLARLTPGRFIDYGCGAGDLLQKAARMGWTSHGVELNEEVAHRVEAQIGLPVTSDAESLAQADVIHLGDVIEHFRLLDRELDRVLALLKPGGLLLGQGPLLSGACLFTFVYRTAGRLRTGRLTDAPPTQLVASTRIGIRHLIERRKLRLSDFRINEVAWPGPWRWELNPKSAALFALRRLSQRVSRWAPDRLGNRYRFAAFKGS